MTIERARIILSNYANLSDTDIQAILDCFNGVIEVGLSQFERKYKIKVNSEKSE